MYRQLKDSLTGEIRTDSIQRIKDESTIPIDERNSDYQNFLQWQEEGNKILPPNN